MGECVSVNVCVGEYEEVYVYVCTYECVCERECECVWVCMSEGVGEYGSVSVCV